MAVNKAKNTSSTSKTTAVKSTTAKASTVSVTSTTPTQEQVEPRAELTQDTQTVSSPTSQDIQAQMLQMMNQMKTQLDSLNSEFASTKKELAFTQQELANAKEELEKAKNPTPDFETVSYIEPTPLEAVIPPPQVFDDKTNTLAERFLETMANRKADKEITIVHNCEILVNGCTTHLKLSNLTIDFVHIGEERTLTYSQFEECVSKYRNFFNRQIILVSDENKDIAEKFSVPCVKRSGATLTRADLDKLGKLTVDNLTKLYNSLTKEDKSFMLSYWLGQCYNKDPNFYNRNKIETLNALSGTGVFDVLLTYMNGEYIREKNTQEAELLKKTTPKLNVAGGNFVGTV